MTREEVHDLMENELRCVQRGNNCDRDCAKCPLVKEDKELIEAYGYVIKALEQEPRWIPVSERLPEESKAVLVWCPERKNIYCAYYEEKQWWIFGAYWEKITLEVIAWMPLPQPYKAETEDT